MDNFSVEELKKAIAIVYLQKAVREFHREIFYAKDNYPELAVYKDLDNCYKTAKELIDKAKTEMSPEISNLAIDRRKYLEHLKVLLYDKQKEEKDLEGA